MARDAFSTAHRRERGQEEKRGTRKAGPLKQVAHTRRVSLCRFVQRLAFPPSLFLTTLPSSLCLFRRRSLRPSSLSAPITMRFNISLLLLLAVFAVVVSAAAAAEGESVCFFGETFSFFNSMHQSRASLPRRVFRASDLAAATNHLMISLNSISGTLRAEKQRFEEIGFSSKYRQLASRLLSLFLFLFRALSHNQKKSFSFSQQAPPRARPRASSFGGATAAGEDAAAAGGTTTGEKGAETETFFFFFVSQSRFFFSSSFFHSPFRSNPFSSLLNKKQGRRLQQRLGRRWRLGRRLVLGGGEWRWRRGELLGRGFGVEEEKIKEEEREKRERDAFSSLKPPCAFL